ncbi:transglutaminase domain-containing protein [Nitrosomonas sp. Nm33]|uniref:transglutaminase domain-containing protein n=1 Tax=Nitrosomonas sp. Nm33 TaxID=133724 RepID=UPI00089D6E88|nr:transglutaminase domain-containing protein [Nitrosomonas sp. Nm33]SDY68613.1 Transglutaminase-like enzyme, putative cysteine protease [Nitrosomonas sp. Nm33]
MKRRDFIKLISASATLLPITPSIFAQTTSPGKWRSYRLSYQVTLPTTGKNARLWLPLPDTNDTPYQFTQGSVWNGSAKSAKFYTLPQTNFPAFYAEWNGNDERHVTVSSIVKTAERQSDLQYYNAPGKAVIPDNIKRFLQSTQQIPLDGIVRKTASSITKDSNNNSPLQKARLIYDWVIDNATHDQKVRGRGKGDVKQMLASENLNGKCADINALFVGLARASGIPARQQFGIRINESVLNKNLGKFGDVSTAQHCRAEFYLAGLGWVPADPADVCKVIALEGLPRNHEQVNALREKLFGAWEMNWVAFNHGENISLGQNGKTGKVPFFLYPHAEIDGQQLDNLEPQTFSYKIASAALVGTGAKF